MTRTISLLLDQKDQYQSGLAEEASVHASRRGLTLDGAHYFPPVSELRPA